MVKIELYFDWEEDAPRYLNCLPFLGQGIEVREMGGFFMSVGLRLRHGRSTRGARGRGVQGGPGGLHPPLEPREASEE